MLAVKRALLDSDWRNRLRRVPPDVVLYCPGLTGGGVSSTVEDWSGKENDGTIVGATWGIAGLGIHYLSFDGVDDDVTVTRTADLDINGHTTLRCSAWIYPKSDGENDEGSIIYKVKAGVVLGYVLRVREEVGGVVKVEGQVGHDGAAQATAITSTTISINAWHKVTMNYNRTSDKKIEMYLDGALASLGTDTAGIGTVRDDSAADLFLGAHDDGSRTFDGYQTLWTTSIAVWTAQQEAESFEWERKIFGV